MSEFAVLLGGDILVTKRLIAQVSNCRVIAADSGIRHAREMAIDVELWVGDLDSATPDDVSDFHATKREEWPSAKDQTDGELAIARAIKLGATSLLIVGAFGGRTSHATNHLLMAFGFDIDVRLTSGREEAMVVKGTVAPDWNSGTEFSVLAFDDLTGVTIRGARWPLQGVHVRCGSGWTLSNIVDGALEVSVDAGRAVLVGELGTA